MMQLTVKDPDCNLSLDQFFMSDTKSPNFGWSTSQYLHREWLCPLSYSSLITHAKVTMQYKEYLLRLWIMMHPVSMTTHVRAG